MFLQRQFEIGELVYSRAFQFLLPRLIWADEQEEWEEALSLSMLNDDEESAPHLREGMPCIVGECILRDDLCDCIAWVITPIGNGWVNTTFLTGAP